MMRQTPSSGRSGHRLRSLAAAIATLLLLSAAPPATPTPLQEKDDLDRELVEKAIAAVEEIRLRMGEATPREIALGIFAFGTGFKVYPDDGDAYVLGLEYLLTDECWKEERIFHEDEGRVRLRRFKDRRRLVTEKIPHEMMMYLAVAGVALDTKVITDNDEEVTWKDVVETAKADVDPRLELSGSLTSFVSYLDWAEEWEIGSKKKKKVTQEKLLKEALRKNPGVHDEGGAWHLFALSTIRSKRASAGGLPEKVETFIDERLKQRRMRLKSQQSSGGSLGILGVKGLEITSRDLNWLLISGSWEEVRQPWLDRAAIWLAKELENATKRKNVRYETLALGARALREYRRLRFPGPSDGPGEGPGGGKAGPGKITD